MFVPSTVIENALKSSMAGLVPKLMPLMEAVLLPLIVGVPTAMPPLLVWVMLRLNGLPPFSGVVLAA